jgi:hypothetical protein
MTDLSPAAQAVLTASLCVSSSGSAPLRHRQCVAAALRAAADQVAPEDFDYWDGRTGEYGAGCETGQNERNAHVRKELLAIAAELETTND